MGLFSQKRKVGIEEFCQEFYDSYVFHQIVAGSDVGQLFYETVFKSVAEADPSFAVIDQAVFQREMTALRIELFGLAWVHHLKLDKYTLPQATFTKRYLQQVGQPHMWGIMTEYNGAVGRSMNYDANGKLLTAESMKGRGSIAFRDSLRMSLFEKWVKAGVDSDCAARVANRRGTDVNWSKGVTAMTVSFTLLERLERDPDSLNNEALFRLRAVVVGNYTGAKQFIQSAAVLA